MPTSCQLGRWRFVVTYQTVILVETATVSLNIHCAPLYMVMPSRVSHLIIAGMRYFAGNADFFGLETRFGNFCDSSGYKEKFLVYVGEVH